MYSTLDICISDHTTFHGNSPSGIYTAIPTGNVVHVSAQCVPISLFLSTDWFLRDHDYDRMYKIGDVSEFFFELRFGTFAIIIKQMVWFCDLHVCC